MFTDEATFHVSGRVNTRNAIIWGTENPHLSYELKRATPEVNVWCGVTHDKMYGPFIFVEETVRATSYLHILEEFVLPQLTQDRILDIIFQHDGAPPHWDLIVQEF
jgi:hypothetical protein